MENTLKRTAKQNREFHIRLQELKIDEDTKQELVLQFSNGRVRSSKDLFFEEMDQLILHLRYQGSSIKPKEPKPIDPCDKMRKKIISICHEMGWKLANGKIDMKRVNEFCEKRGHGKKRLDDYEYKELPLLITQFEKTLKDFYNAR